MLLQHVIIFRIQPKLFTCVNKNGAKEGAKIFIANKHVVGSCTFAVYLQ